MNNDFQTEEEWVKTVATYFHYDYRDRGKVKWNGFFLSDHTAKLKAQKADQNLASHETLRPPMDYQQIQLVVGQAASNRQRITIQLDTRNADGFFSPLISGKVTGFFESGFYLDQEPQLWEEMRYVEVNHDK
ncbi:hypothetical protein [Fructobacillus ficulneus]|uniref:DNA-directed RNA polymerase beta subunit n=1 Tax=Fructobacillus ficulneus TaxID=157463 RepID=A0A0K8MJP0_9LACO|nr:hypothetical protein [Fructobacillus ficulneus]GAP00394.1 hypothetical protein FFIC_284110 [Fructobacillus ficulneus]